jgi:hypothetical protein
MIEIYRFGFGQVHEGESEFAATGDYVFRKLHGIDSVQFLIVGASNYSC